MSIDRQFLATTSRRYLLQGKPKQADVYVVQWNGDPVVVKDYGGKKWPQRLLGRYILWREYRNYRFLQQFDFVPRLIQRIDDLAFCIEYVDGPTVADLEGRPEYAWVPEELDRVVALLHQHRFFHLDLRKRGNIMVTDHQLVLIDFASSFRFSRFNPIYWLLGPVLRYTDRSAVIKWKAFIHPQSLNEQERRFLRRFEWTRMLWFFNKPRLPKPPKGPDNGG